MYRFTTHYVQSNVEFDYCSYSDILGLLIDLAKTDESKYVFVDGRFDFGIYKYFSVRETYRIDDIDVNTVRRLEHDVNVHSVNKVNFQINDRVA